MIWYIVSFNLIAIACALVTLLGVHRHQTLLAAAALLFGILSHLLARLAAWFRRHGGDDVR